jgi:hypothetical protein
MAEIRVFGLERLKIGSHSVYSVPHFPGQKTNLDGKSKADKGPQEKESGFHVEQIQRQSQHQRHHQIQQDLLCIQQFTKPKP